MDGFRDMLGPVRQDAWHVLSSGNVAEDGKLTKGDLNKAEVGGSSIVGSDRQWAEVPEPVWCGPWLQLQPLLH